MTLQHEVVIDLTRPQRIVIPVTQEDSTRQIALRLLYNGAPYNVSNDLASGETLLKFVEYRRADGSSGIYDTTSDGRTAVVAVSPASGGKWTVNLDGACFTVPGWAQINVRFMTESGKLLHSFPITVDVHDTACPDESGGDPTQIESIADMKAAISELYNASMSEEAKNALLNLLAHVAYIDEHGQDYYDALEAELFRTADLVSISAVFEQGSAVIYDTDDLDTLRQYLTVTATYEDMSTREIAGYTLSGTLIEGTSTITVSYDEKTTTFTVTVTGYVPGAYQKVEWIQSSGGQVIITDYEPDYSDLPSHKMTVEVLVPSGTVSTTEIFAGFSGWGGQWIGTMTNGKLGLGSNIGFANVDRTQKNTVVMTWDASTGYATIGNETIQRGTSDKYDLTLALFATYAEAFWAKARIYHLLLEKDDSVVVDLYPCYRKSDSVIGMYDAIGRKFYSNEGTGTFTKGGDIA